MVFVLAGLVLFGGCWDAVWITHSPGSPCPSVKGETWTSVMLQDKPAPEKAPSIILLFGNGGPVLTESRAVHLFQRERGRTKRRKKEV